MYLQVWSVLLRTGLSMALAQHKWEVAIFMTPLMLRLLNISNHELIILKRFPWICTVLTVGDLLLPEFLLQERKTLHGGSVQALPWINVSPGHWGQEASSARSPQSPAHHGLGLYSLVLGSRQVLESAFCGGG